MKIMIMLPCLILLLFVVAASSFVYAAHPLITDDTGTQGKGKVQLELNGEYASDKETPAAGLQAIERTAEVGVTFSYGVTDAIDAVLGVPYARFNVRESDQTTPSFVEAEEAGLSDLSLEVKWRLWEKEGLGLAVKPGLSVPTGDEDRGLGAGKYGYSVFLIGTREAASWTFHANLGYVRNENKADELEDLWHLSLATEYAMNERLRIVGNVGQERNPDRNDSTMPVFALAGLIYGISENIDVDFGIKAGLTDPEADFTALAGLAVRL